MTEHIKHPDWPERAKLTDNEKYDKARTIRVVFVENIVRGGGYYSVWQGEENVFEGDFYKAKKEAMRAQGENGRPIERNVKAA